jgi:uncharacterized membrane protein YgcG
MRREGIPTPTTAPLTPSAATGTPADPNEPLDGLRARLAQLERRLGVRTYALGAAVVLALAAGAVGVVLALSVQRDAATQDDIAALRDEVAAARVSATQAARKDGSTSTGAGGAPTGTGAGGGSGGGGGRTFGTP